MSDSSQPRGLQPTRLLHPWIFQARVLEWGAIAFSEINRTFVCNFQMFLSHFYNERATLQIESIEI